MWKTADLVTLTGLYADVPSGPSAGASFSTGRPVGSGKCEAVVASPGRGGQNGLAMAVLRRSESTTGPVAFGGRTIMLVARTTTVQIGSDALRAVHIRSRPLHVEVLDEHGQRQVVPVRDLERALVAAIAIVGIAGACARRARGSRPNRRRRSP